MNHISAPCTTSNARCITQSVHLEPTLQLLAHFAISALYLPMLPDGPSYASFAMDRQSSANLRSAAAAAWMERFEGSLGYVLPQQYQRRNSNGVGKKN